MKEFWSLVRIALAVLALPLAATAAVSALSSGGAGESAAVASLRALAESRMTASFRNHAVSIDDQGVVRGRVVSAAGGNVAGLGEMKVFFVRDGKIASQVFSGEDGSFEAAGLSEGNYSFIASGKNGFAAFGVRASNSENLDTNNLIEVGAVSPKNDRVLEILNGHLPGEVVSEISNNAASGSPAPGANRVQVVAGKMVGQLTALAGNLQNAVVHLVRDNQEIGSTAALTDGSFEFEGVEPGMYEFVATSATGMAALSFEAVAQEETIVSEQLLSESVVANRPTFQSFDTALPAQNLAVAMTLPQDGEIVEEQFEYVSEPYIVEEVTYSEPYTIVGDDIGMGAAMGGSYGSAGAWGGFGGGGGAGFLGGGLPGIARLAILGWVLTELFDEIDFSRPPADASPNNI